MAAGQVPVLYGLGRADPVNGRSSTFGGVLGYFVIAVIVIVALAQLGCLLDGYCG